MSKLPGRLMPTDAAAAFMSDGDMPARLNPGGMAKPAAAAASVSAFDEPVESMDGT